jgi:hypothetical protein
VGSIAAEGELVVVHFDYDRAVASLTIVPNHRYNTLSHYSLAKIMSFASG